MMFNRILFATDASKHSEKTIPVATKLAQDSDGEVIVVHVREHERAHHLVELEKEVQARAQAVADDVTRQFKDLGVNVRSEILRAALQHGVADRIVEAAQEESADIIVMGSRGLTDLRGLLRGGSITHQVVHLSDRPVLIIPAGRRRSQQ